MRVEFPFPCDDTGQCATVGGGLAGTDNDREEVAESGHLFDAKVPQRRDRSAADTVPQKVRKCEEGIGLV